MSIGRICLGVRMPNLASAALARSRELYVEQHAADEGTHYLQTFVRADFPGSMIRALRDKGWTCVGVNELSETTNRDHKPIRERWKWDWLCHINTVKAQAQRELTDFPPPGVSASR